MDKIKLYGAPLSLYTGRPRSYFIKAGLAYREVMPNTPHYRNTVLPAAGSRQGMPTIETETGEVIRDGVAIIDHYEEVSGGEFSPATPKQRVISRLFDVIGAEGLLRPAMHYRWNYPDLNHEFLHFHFSAVQPDTPERQERAEGFMQQMRNAAQMFGAVPETFKVVEALYEELLEKLDAHLSDHPYLLGGKPCIGDFGMMAPLYAHLGRDPAPLALMQKKAIRLFRWVERMNRPEPDVGEFGDVAEAYQMDDEIPQTLIEVLKTLAEDFVPETKAAAACINDWIATQENLEPETLVERGVGLGSFDVRGVTINALAQPFRFYLLKRVQDEVGALEGRAKEEVNELLASCNMKELLDIKISRDIGRKNNREIWL